MRGYCSVSSEMIRDGINASIDSVNILTLDAGAGFITPNMFHSSLKTLDRWSHFWYTKSQKSRLSQSNFCNYFAYLMRRLQIPVFGTNDE